MEPTVDQAIRKAATLARQGRPADAEKVYNEILRRYPSNRRAQEGLRALATGREGLPRTDLETLMALHGQGRFGELAEVAAALAQRYPAAAAAHVFEGSALAQLGSLAASLASYDRAVALEPGDVEAHCGRGNVLRALGRSHDALASFDDAIRIRPGVADIHHRRGNALLDLRKLAEAAASFDAAIALKPDLAGAHYGRASALHLLARPQEALVSCERALALAPEFAEVRHQHGLLLRGLKRPQEAIASFEAALRLRPDFSAAAGPLLYTKAELCDWREPAQAIDIAGIGFDGTPVSTFNMLFIEDHPARQLERANRWAATHLPGPRMPLPRPPGRPAKLRIGYFSADFCEHAMMYLIGKVFETHDRERFEAHAFAFGRRRHDAMRQRVLAAFDRFHDIEDLSDSDAAALARAEGIDVAVDLTGYTRGARAAIFGLGAAPVQINYLGYPGTMGGDFMDYILADSVIIPPGHEKFHAEKVIRLPHTYQSTDNGCTISDRHFTRSEQGLPPDGFVFSCFNGNAKIAPAEFDIWMRLLRGVAGSVLWLIDGGPDATANLRREAAARGVDPDRLVFAKRLPRDQHLARHRCADLFLDTFIYNAHTTATDALWSGLPLVTKTGSGFAARVAASLLRAIGMPELVTASAEEYEQLALGLAADRTRLAAIKAKLAANRLTTPLFDTDGFTRALERAYDLAYDRCAAGLTPDHIDVG